MLFTFLWEPGSKKGDALALGARQDITDEQAQGLLKSHRIRRALSGKTPSIAVELQVEKATEETSRPAPRHFLTLSCVRRTHASLPETLNSKTYFPHVPNLRTRKKSPGPKAPQGPSKWRGGSFSELRPLDIPNPKPETLEGLGLGLGFRA